MRPKVISWMSSNFLAYELNDTSYVNAKTDVPGPVFITGRGLWKDFFPTVHINKYSPVSNRKKQPVQGEWTPDCWPTWILGMFCRLPWLLVLFCLFFNWDKEKVHLQTLLVGQSCWGTVLIKCTEFPQQLLTVDFDLLLLIFSALGLHTVAF